LIEVELDTQITLGAHLDSGAGEAGRPHVLDGDDRAGLHQLEAGFQQAFLGKRVANLNGGALFLYGFVELCRGHGGAADAVAAGLGAEIDHRQADALGFRQEDRVGPGDTGSKGVDQAVAVVARIELDLAADGGHAEGIAVAADTGDDARDQVPGLGMIRRAEAQRVHGRDRPGAHGEDIAQDAADAGGSPLVGLDVGGVVVALHLEDDAIAIADIDHAGVLAGTLDHARAGGRQGSEPLLRGFVGAVLVPHGREDAELGEGRFTPDEIENALVFLGLEPVGGNQLFGDGNDV
jgi:hypothetical protein